MGRAPRLQGGGAGGGSVEIPGSRPRVVADRVKVTNKTVGEGLVDAMAGLSDADIKNFGEVLRSAAREAEAGDTRASQTYGLALSQLAVRSPEKWAKIVQASGIPPKQFGRVFQDLNTPIDPVRDVTDAQAISLAEDAPIVNQPRIAPQNMPEGGVAPVFYDPSQALSANVGGALSAQGMPVVERAPLASPHSWAHILGNSELGDAQRIRGTPPNATMTMFPQLARFENIRYLRDLTGLPFTVRVGGPEPKGAVKKALQMIDESQNAQGGAGVQYDFGLKEQMRPDAERVVTEDAMADDKIPATDKARVIKMRTQELMDRMPAATYPEELGTKLRELLLAGDQPDMSGPAPQFVPDGFDPVAAQAALEAEVASMPDAEASPQFVIDTNLVGGSPTTSVSPLARLIGEGDENVRPVWEAAANDTGLPNLQYEVGLPGYWERRGSMPGKIDVFNRSRSALEKALEEHNSVLLGQAPTPRVVQGLLMRSPNEDLVNLIQRNLGGIYDLDNRSPRWRGGVVFGTPDNPLQFPIPPDVLAGLYARQLGIQDPNVVAQMVDPMTVSSDIIGQAKPSGRAGALLKKSEGYVEPRFYKVGVGGRGGVSAQQANELKAMLLESIQMNNQRLKDLGRTPPILFKTQPKSQPPIINMQGASLMPESSRFDNFRVNPLMRLVG